MEDLSVVIIAKDNADTIADTVRNGFEFGQEVVVVDTGSIDDTVAVAQEAGATTTVLEEEFDFSTARNHGNDVAKGPWLFHLDTDERVDSFNYPFIEDIRRKPKNSVYAVKQHHAQGSGFLNRLFRKGVHEYSGLIFEDVSPTVFPTLSEVVVTHLSNPYGHRSDTSNRRKLARQELQTLFTNGVPDSHEERIATMQRLWHLAPVSFAKSSELMNAIYDRQRPSERATIHYSLFVERHHKNFEEAHRILLNLPKTHRLSPDYFFVAAHQCTALKDYEKGLAYCDTLSQLRPSSYDEGLRAILHAVAFVYGGRPFNPAFEAYEKARTMSPDNPTLLHVERMLTAARTFAT